MSAIVTLSLKATYVLTYLLIMGSNVSKTTTLYTEMSVKTGVHSLAYDDCSEHALLLL